LDICDSLSDGDRHLTLLLYLAFVLFICFVLFCSLVQDPAPLTEDGFEEQTKMLVQLGDNEEGTEKRAKLMSASLVSDMQSFKVKPLKLF